MFEFYKTLRITATKENGMRTAYYFPYNIKLVTNTDLSLVLTVTVIRNSVA